MFFVYCPLCWVILEFYVDVVVQCKIVEFMVLLDSSYLVPDETVAVGTLLAAGNGAVVEVVLLTHIAASTDEAGATLAPAVVSALSHPGALGVAVAGCEKRQSCSMTSATDRNAPEHRELHESRLRLHPDELKPKKLTSQRSQC